MDNLLTMHFLFPLLQHALLKQKKLRFGTMTPMNREKRPYRPKIFAEVVGQQATVHTLKNAIKKNRLANAYLFCGSHGTGKTTLARLFAKALNCQQLSPDIEPCNQCIHCRHIDQANSLDVLEIDG